MARLRRQQQPKMADNRNGTLFAVSLWRWF
jgi:hypothetical protein